MDQKSGFFLNFPMRTIKSPTLIKHDIKVIGVHGWSQYNTSSFIEAYGLNYYLCDPTYSTVLISFLS